MGRSVETIGDHIVYFSWQFDAENDYGVSACEDWENLIDNLQYNLSVKYKSLETVKGKWVPYPYRENKIILENRHVQISISEYCSCSAVSVFIHPDSKAYWPYSTVLADHWLDQCWSGIVKIIKQYVTVLSRLGTMSNGVSVFKKKS